MKKLWIQVFAYFICPFECKIILFGNRKSIDPSSKIQHTGSECICQLTNLLSVSMKPSDKDTAKKRDAQLQCGQWYANPGVVAYADAASQSISQSAAVLRRCPKSDLSKTVHFWWSASVDASSLLTLGLYM